MIQQFTYQQKAVVYLLQNGWRFIQDALFDATYVSHEKKGVLPIHGKLLNSLKDKKLIEESNFSSSVYLLTEEGKELKTTGASNKQLKKLFPKIHLYQ